MNTLIVIALLLFTSIFASFIDKKNELEDLDFDIFDDDSLVTGRGFPWTRLVPPPPQSPPPPPPPPITIPTPPTPPPPPTTIPTPPTPPPPPTTIPTPPTPPPPPTTIPTPPTPPPPPTTIPTPPTPPPPPTTIPTPPTPPPPPTTIPTPPTPPPPPTTIPTPPTPPPPPTTIPTPPTPPPPPTTIPTPPTPPIFPCPPEMSLHTKKDIKILIDYRVKTLSIYNSINNSYYSQAVAVRDKHMNDFNHFRSWYQNRPEHLKHNVKDIDFLRGHMESLAKRIANALDQYPHYLEKYEKKLNKTNKLLAKLNRYKIICENNCVSMGVFHISRKSNFNGYYCSSLEELDQKITSDLVEFANKTNSIMLDRVTHDDKVIAEKIDVLKNKLKDVALKEFGRTMYDLLSLQDEYHHFLEDLLKVDANSVIHQIKQTNLHIDTKIFELEQHIEKYGTYCRTCNGNSLRFLSKKIYNVLPLQDEIDESEDLLNDLLNITHYEIQNSTNKDYFNIFKELNVLLNNTDSMAIHLTNFEPIQEEIKEMIKEQRTKFKELKTIASMSSISKLVKLSSDSKELLSKILTEIKQLDPPHKVTV